MKTRKLRALTRLKLHLQTTGSPLTEQQDLHTAEAFFESCTPACAEETGDSGGHRHGRPTSAGPSRPRTCRELPRGLLYLLSLLFPTSDCISKLIKAALN